MHACTVLTLDRHFNIGTRAHSTSPMILTKFKMAARSEMRTQNDSI